ncbi:MAG: HEPN domain-containing protein [Candidatus Eisenbacteria bacterium]|nr:HEPN domain-containing protein [Candidatus Eisenbacteria bacterium]
MNDTTREWFTKAEADFRTAQREMRATDDPNLDAVCFHAQQCVEKLMKGLLLQHGEVPPRTHDLIELAKLVRARCPAWSAPVEDLRFLVRAGVAYRYPGESADRTDAEEALAVCSKLRASLLALRAE